MEKIRFGTLVCPCGVPLYFETVNDKINCLGCHLEHDITSYPFKDEPVEVEFQEIEGDQNGTDI